MDFKHFGDSYDIVKQSFLRWLSPCGVWNADPMFTSATSPIEAAAFSSFLGVDLVTSQVFKHARRSAYFTKASSCPNHLFLDPDTGLRIEEPPREREKFLLASELRDIAKARPEKLTMVYEQSINHNYREFGSPEAQVKEKLLWLEAQGLSSFGYVSHVCFILVCGNQRILDDAKHVFLQVSRLPPTRLVE